MLSDNLKVHFPSLNNHFLCPTCQTAISLNKKNKITEAHIIPKAARGALKTYLCDKCNSFFGTNQDKWFGEYLKIMNKGIPEIFSTDIKDGCFWIDNIKVNGNYETGENNELNFIINKDRNPPAIFEQLINKFQGKPPSISLRISLPILKNKRLIEIGFLTAGYLMWFGALGYSWVLQEHLNIVREQILNPNQEILKTRFIAFCEGIRWKKPWIGLVSIANEILLTMGLENCLVLFPPADRPDICSKLGNEISYYIRRDIRLIHFSPKPFYGPSVSVCYDNRLLVWPNAEHNMTLHTAIVFTSDSLVGKVLSRSISRQEAEELKKNYDVTVISPEVSPKIGKWEIKRIID